MIDISKLDALHAKAQAAEQRLGDKRIVLSHDERMAYSDDICDWVEGLLVAWPDLRAELMTLRDKTQEECHVVP
jgi:hypothetical protein